MEKLKDTFKSRYRHIVLIAASCISYYYVLSSLLYALLATLITLVTSLALLVLIQDLKKNMDKKTASLSFFASFLFKIDNSLSCRNAYETSLHCLIGYYDLLSYDMLLEDPSSFNTDSSYDVYFREVIRKENENEVHLFDYSILSDEAYEESERLIKRREALERSMIVGEMTVSFILLALVLLFVFLPGTADLSSSLLYNILSTLILSLMMPSSLLSTYIGYRRASHV